MKESELVYITRIKVLNMSNSRTYLDPNLHVVISPYYCPHLFFVITYLHLQ
jgi:hypothetical protein